MNKSKQAYYDKYFEKNWINVKNTWKGIKSLISLKTKTSSAPNVLSFKNGDTITNPYHIPGTFNNYFASIAETTKRTIKYSHKHFADYLSNESSSTIFLQPTDKEEIAIIASSLNSNRTSGPNSIPYTILFLLKKCSFKTTGRFIQHLLQDWCFSFCTQNCKNNSFFKKDSKLDYSNYRQISLLY